VATWIALLRGVNVVGRRPLPMKDLATLLERDGFRNVRTYIQSGNVLFATATGGARAHATRIGALLERRYGFEASVMVLGVPELARAIAANPFPAADGDPKAVHVFFLASTPRAPDLASLERLRAGREAFALDGRVFYLHTPDGFPASKLAARAERLLGVAATARNWRTTTTLLAMARERR
jgi:uncharacterized protein (DUF1697 family)